MLRPEQAHILKSHRVNTYAAHSAQMAEVSIINDAERL